MYSDFLNTTVCDTIYKDEWLGNPEIDYKYDELATSVRIKYFPRYDTGESRSVTNLDYEGISYSKYKTKKELEYETILANEADAITGAAVLSEKFKDIVPIVSGTLKTQHIDLELPCSVNAEIPRNGKIAIPNSKWEVLSIDKDLNNNTIDIIMRFMEKN
jgi:hypothetical protein